MIGGLRSREAGRFFVVVYAPTLLFAVGLGAVLPVIALSARELGASVGVAGLVVALSGIGLILGDLPAGALAERVGERWAMIIALIVTVAALAGCVLAPSVALLGLCILVFGAANAVFTLARVTFMADVLPAHSRGRGMSLLGGSYRIGLAIGPFAGAWASGSMGIDGAYVVHLVAAVATLVLVWFLPELPELPELAELPDGRRPDTNEATEPDDAGRSVTMWGVLREHRRVLATVGLAALLVGAARNARLTIIPLWCESAGLDVAQTSLVVGVSGVLELVLFYPAGALMDRVGRGAVGGTAMLLVAVGLGALPFGHTVSTIMVAAAVVGLGNGLSSGLVLTLGADVAPAHGRSLFFGGWRLISDVGTALGPVTVGVVAAVASLVAACAAAAALAAGAAAAVWKWAPPHEPQPAR